MSPNFPFRWDKLYSREGSFANLNGAPSSWHITGVPGVKSNGGQDEFTMNVVSLSSSLFDWLIGPFTRIFFPLSKYSNAWYRPTFAVSTDITSITNRCFISFNSCSIRFVVVWSGLWTRRLRAAISIKTLFANNCSCITFSVATNFIPKAIASPKFPRSIASAYCCFASLNYCPVSLVAYLFCT